MVERRRGATIGIDTEREEIEVSHGGAQRPGDSRQLAWNHCMMRVDGWADRTGIQMTVVPRMNGSMVGIVGNGSIRFSILDLSRILFCFDSALVATILPIAGEEVSS